nr:Ig-like domain-containing protein [Marimonas lutisalis]
MGATQTVDTGGVDVTVGFQGIDEGAQAFAFYAEGYVASDDPFSAFSFLKLFVEGGEGGIDDTSTTTISFAASDVAYGDEVQNVSFRINDIDSGVDDTGEPSGYHLDLLTIRAYDANGNEVPVTIIPGADVTGGSNTLEGGSAWEPTDGEGSALVQIDGPVSQIVIEYDNAGDGDQRVMVSDIHFSTTDSNDVDAVDDAASTDLDTPVIVPVLDNDSDAQGDSFTVTGVTDGTNGTVAIDPVSGNPVYTPDAGFTGTDTFDYTITDDLGAIDTASVTVTVGDGTPVNTVDAVDDTATTDVDTPVMVLVVSNDVDPQGDDFDVTGVTDGANGTVVIDPVSGMPVYTPNPASRAPTRSNTASPMSWVQPIPPPSPWRPKSCPITSSKVARATT